MPPNPGNGYRLLNPGELVTQTDEFFCCLYHGWFVVTWPANGWYSTYKHPERDVYYRREA